MTDGKGFNNGPHMGDPQIAGERDSGMLLDEELKSAAAPILYLLASVTIAAGGYLLFAALRG